MAKRTWQDVCRAITKEYDSEKLMSLIQELNCKLDQHAHELRLASVIPQQCRAEFLSSRR